MQKRRQILILCLVHNIRYCAADSLNYRLRRLWPLSANCSSALPCRQNPQKSSPSANLPAESYKSIPDGMPTRTVQHVIGSPCSGMWPKTYEKLYSDSAPAEGTKPSHHQITNTQPVGLEKEGIPASKKPIWRCSSTSKPPGETWGKRRHPPNHNHA